MKGAPSSYLTSTVPSETPAVLTLISDESFSGRVPVWWIGEQRGLIAIGDPGDLSLEPCSGD